MIYRGSDNEYGRDKALAANMVPASLRPEVRTAVREWLDASKAWSTLRQAIEANGDSGTARRRLEELERRLNAAAEAVERAQRHSFLCTAAAGERQIRFNGKREHPVPVRESRYAAKENRGLRRFFYVLRRT